jgi:hypothetical protein
MRRGLVAIVMLGACIDVAEKRATDPTAPDGGVAVAEAPAAPIVRRPGGAVRVEASRSHPGYGAFVGVWRHKEDGQVERLELRRDGTFDWSIDRSGTVCQIAGTVALGTAVPKVDGQAAPSAEGTGEGPALTWTMTTNTCNSSYQGRTASDMILAHDFDHLVLKDAEFSLDPVPYEREP